MLMVLDLCDEMVSYKLIDLPAAVHNPTRLSSVLAHKSLRERITSRKILCPVKNAADVKNRELSNSEANLDRQLDSINNIHIVQLGLDGQSCLNGLTTSVLQVL